MVGVMVVMLTSFKKMYARAVVFSALDPKAGHCWLTPLLEAPKHSQASLAQSLVETCSLEEIYDQFRQHIKKQSHYFADKGPSRQSYGFSSSHVWMWELDHKEVWAPKIWNFELWCSKLFERPLTARRSDQSILKEISPEYSLKRLMLKLKSNTYWLIWKDPDAGKSWRQEEKGT